MFVEGIREKARVKLDTWLHQDTDSERVCCVTGPLGSGKTTLAAEFCGLKPDGDGTRVVKKQRREGEEGARLITAFHFFQGDDNLALNKCWAKVGRQLAGRLGYDLVGDDSTEEDSLFVFRRFIAEPLTRLSKPSNKIVVLVDGVDKLLWETQESFWEIVSQTWERETPMWVHLAVFSYATLRLTGAIRWIDLQDENHEKDIELLCNARLATFMQDEEDVQYATKHIVKHSTERPTVLLYATCVLDALLEGRSHRSVTLDDIWEMNWRPECLIHAFRPYLIRFWDHVMDGDMDRYQQLLSCLSATRTPLSIDVAAEALEMNNESLKALLSRSTSLIYQEGDVIKFAHPCLKDVVQHRRCGKHPDGSPLQVKATHGHEWFVGFLQASPTSPLALRDMFYHLCSSCRWSAVPEYLLDFDWVLALVSEEGCALKLIEDADKLYNDKPYADVNATDVVRAIDLGIEAILADSALLKQQIVGRIPDETHPIRRSYESSLFAQTERAKSVFLPVTQTLQPARSSFRKRMRIDGHGVYFPTLQHQVLPMAYNSRFLVLGGPNGLVYWDASTETYQEIPKWGFQGYPLLNGFLGVWHWERGEIRDWRFDKPIFCAGIRSEELVSAALNDTVYARALSNGDQTYTIEVFDLSLKCCVWHTKGDGASSNGSLALQDDLVFFCMVLCNGSSLQPYWLVSNFRTGEAIVQGEYQRGVNSWYHSPEPRLLVSGNILCLREDENTFQIWNWRSGQLEKTLHGARNIDLAKGLYTDGKAVRDLQSGALLGSFWDGAEKGCRWDTAFFRNCFLACGQLHILNPSLPVRSCMPCRVVQCETNEVLSIGRATATLWDLNLGRVIRTFDCSPFFATNISSISCMSDKYVVCIQERAPPTVVVWEKATGKTLTTAHFDQHDWITGAGACKDSVVLLNKTLVQELDPCTGLLLRSFQLPCEPYHNVKFISDRLVFGSVSLYGGDHKFRGCTVIVQYETGEVIRSFGGGSMTSYSAHGDIICKLERDPLHSKIWNWRTGQELFQGDVYVRDFSSGANLVLFHSENRTGQVYDTLRQTFLGIVGCNGLYVQQREDDISVVDGSLHNGLVLFRLQKKERKD